MAGSHGAELVECLVVLVDVAALFAFGVATGQDVGRQGHAAHHVVGVGVFELSTPQRFADRGLHRHLTHVVLEPLLVVEEGASVLVFQVADCLHLVGEDAGVVVAFDAEVADVQQRVGVEQTLA